MCPCSTDIQLLDITSVIQIFSQNSWYTTYLEFSLKIHEVDVGRSTWKNIKLTVGSTRFQVYIFLFPHIKSCFNKSVYCIQTL